MSKERSSLKWLYDKINLPTAGLEIVEYIRHSDPVRNVDGGGHSVCGDYKSRAKMHLSIQFESRTVEYVFVIQCEFDDNTIEYWDQPYRIKLSYVRSDGRKISHLHTPDYLVITKTEIYFVECKPESKLVKLAKTKPEKYIQNQDGTWSCPPAEEAVSEWGIGYRIVSSSQLSAVFTRNCDFLNDYYFCDPPDNIREFKPIIDQFFVENKTRTLKELLSYIDDADKVYWSLISGFFYLDLEKQLIAAPESAKIYPDKVYAKALISARESTLINSKAIKPIAFTASTRIIWDNIPWTILNVGKSDIVLEDDPGNLITLKHSQIEDLIIKGDIVGVNSNVDEPSIAPMLNARVAELAIANERYEKILVVIKHTISLGVGTQLGHSP